MGGVGSKGVKHKGKGEKGKQMFLYDKNFHIQSKPQ